MSPVCHDITLHIITYLGRPFNTKVSKDISRGLSCHLAVFVTLLRFQRCNSLFSGKFHHLLTTSNYTTDNYIRWLMLEEIVEASAVEEEEVTNPIFWFVDCMGIKINHGHIL